ncbi:MAG: hypothetical protein ACFFAH_11085 [Promethearchaeota archaeon]
MIEIDAEFELENNFLENLYYKITQKYHRFYRKVPEYNEKLDDLTFQLKLKESIYKIRKDFEKAQLRKNYIAVVSEYEDLLENH